MKDKKIMKFIRNGLIVVIAVCLLVFFGLTTLMASETQQTVAEISVSRNLALLFVFVCSRCLGL